MDISAFVEIYKRNKGCGFLETRKMEELTVGLSIRHK